MYIIFSLKSKKVLFAIIKKEYLTDMSDHFQKKFYIETSSIKISKAKRI